jgi:tetratricopeptide (TPR) repeat protein
VLRRRQALALAATLPWLAAGCASLDPLQSGAPWPPALPPRVELAAVPFVAQARWHCGPASLAMVAGAVGIDVSADAIADQVFLPAREGSLQVEMLAAARRQGLLAVVLPADLTSLFAELAAGHAVVVLQNLGLAISPRWHYAVVIGYDATAREVLLRSGDEPRQRLSWFTFEQTWARGGRWAFVALPPDRLPATAREADAVQAAVGFERVAVPEAALRAWRTVRQRWPDSLPAAIGLGNALAARGGHDEAAQVLAQAAARHDSAAAWNNLAQVQLRRGDRDAARDAARRAVAAAERPGADARWLDTARATLREAERQPHSGAVRSPHRQGD